MSEKMSLTSRGHHSTAASFSALHSLSPGIWYTIHETALKAPSLSSMLIEHYSLNFFCDHCRQHMVKYIQQHPINHENLFAWTVDFHNSVNKRLGKKLMTHEEALAVYSGGGECSACTVDEHVTPYTGGSHPEERGRSIRVNPYTQR